MTRKKREPTDAQPSDSWEEGMPDDAEPAANIAIVEDPRAECTREVQLADGELVTIIIDEEKVRKFALEIIGTRTDVSMDTREQSVWDAFQ
eukprot:5045354-Pyramimonas_sp.AAC.1